MKNFFNNEDINNILNEIIALNSYFYNKHIVITGGRGFLGSYFIEIFFRLNQIIKKPMRITIIDNSNNNLDIKKRYKKDKNIFFIDKDASKKIHFNRKVDYFIHAAGIASPYYYNKYPLDTLDIAVNGTRNILEKARLNKSKVLFFSSSEIYGDPDSKNIPIKETYRGNVSTVGSRACYDESKRLGETLCYIYNEYYKVNVNIIRPFNIYGPGMAENDFRLMPNFASKIIKNKSLLIYGNGNQTRTYCYISDAMIGFIKVLILGKSGEIYNIGNNKPEVSVNDLVNILQKYYSKDIKSKKIKHPLSYPKDEPQRRCPNIEKAKKHLNFKPKISLRNGLMSFLKWTNKYYNDS